MGSGLTTSGGGRPRDAWANRIDLRVQQELRGPVRQLISGERVVSVDGQVEISQRPLVGVDRIEVTVRVPPPARFKVVLTMRALQEEDPLPPGTARDSREPRPVGQTWRRVIADDTVEWELFNCVIESMTCPWNT